MSSAIRVKSKLAQMFRCQFIKLFKRVLLQFPFSASLIDMCARKKLERQDDKLFFSDFGSRAW